MDVADLPLIISTSVGTGGIVGGLLALLTLRQRRQVLSASAEKDAATADMRIMNAAAGLVEQAGTQVPILIERITRLESSNERILEEQAAERSELAAWRQWGGVQMAWAAQAVAAIRELGGTIADPPAPPTVDRRQTPPT